MKVPVSTPGATDSAKQLAGAADAADRLTKSEEKLAVASGVLGRTTKLTAAEINAVNAAVQRHSVVMRDSSIQVQKVSDTLLRARVEAKRYADEMKRGGGEGGEGGHGGGHSGKSGYLLSRLFPGHENQIMQLSGAAGGGAAVGGLVAALGAAALVVTYNSARIAEQNETAKENIKVNQELATQARDAKMEREANAAVDIKSMRKSSRFILNNDPEGEKAIKDLVAAGAGGEGIANLASLLKNRGNKFGHGANAWTAFDLIEEAKKVRQDTGMDLSDVLGEMSTSQGRYNRTRFERGLTGKTYSPELRAMWKEHGDSSQTGQFLDGVDQTVRSENRFKGEGAFNPSVAGEGLSHELQMLVDPMKWVISEHNKKILEEIAIREQAITAERGIVDWYKEQIDPSGKILSSEATKARKDVRVLSAGLR